MGLMEVFNRETWRSLTSPVPVWFSMSPDSRTRHKDRSSKYWNCSKICVIFWICGFSPVFLNVNWFFEAVHVIFKNNCRLRFFLRMTFTDTRTNHNTIEFKSWYTLDLAFFPQKIHINKLVQGNFNRKYTSTGKLLETLELKKKLFKRF